jgi:hypothetical protein
MTKAEIQAGIQQLESELVILRRALRMNSNSGTEPELLTDKERLAAYRRKNNEN